jgi:MarR family transcriptional regulator, transcriptional regulator for hemolysin
MRPPAPPLGLQLATTAKAVSRAFDDALREAGGSLPVWLVLASLHGERWRTQLELARSVGIEGATLTRHLDAMERAGLVERRRDGNDRRAVNVELTEAGSKLHGTLLEAVIRFNRRLHAGLGDDEERVLRGALEKLRANAGSPGGGVVQV